MIPISLKITGFLSYHDPVTLDFTGFELACISGANGAGKSSLLDAITWALFGQARRKDDALIHANDKAAEVVFDFVYEGNLYRVQRSKPRDKTAILEFRIWQPDGSGLPLSVSQIDNNPDHWKALTEKSLRETELRIQRSLRMDYETFINASFFLQGKADQFAQQRPGDRKRILSGILGLDAWEDYRDRAAGQRKTTETEVSALDGRLNEITSELAEGPARLARLAELEQLLARLTAQHRTQASVLENLRKLAASLAEQRRMVDTLTRQLKMTVTGRDRLASALAQRQAERQTYQQQIGSAPAVEEAYRLWQAARQNLEEWETLAAQYRQHQPRRTALLLEIESERARLVQERQALLAQQSQVSAAQAEIPLVQRQLEQALAAVSRLEAQLLLKSSLSADLEQLRQAQADAKAENPRLKTEMDELKDRIDRLSTVEGALCPLCGQPLNPAERGALVERLGTAGRSLGERYRENQAMLRSGEARRQNLERDLAALGALDQELRQQHRLVDQAGDRLVQVESLANEWHAQGELRLAEIDRLLLENSFAAQPQAQLAAIDQGLQALGYDPQAHEAARQAELLGRASEAALRALETARATLAPLEREIGDLESRLIEQESVTKQQQAAYDQAAASYAASAAQQPDVDQAEGDLLDIQEQENLRRMEVGAARQKVAVLERLRQRQAEVAAQREELTRRIARLKTLERAFGKDGVPALLIEQALPEIENQANQILDRLSGGIMSVRFDTQKDFKDKGREDKKETLGIIISDAEGSRDYELFSGGEAFRVNFAIRLALSRILAQRAGARLQTLVIDEGFGSQDTEGRQRLIEAINLVKRDFSKILVITHLEELKEAFPTRIEVEKTDRGSSLRVL